MYAEAAIGEPSVVFVAARREALARAGDGVEELVLTARDLDAFSAAAAVLIEGVGRSATSVLNAIADAAASLGVPVEVGGADLVEASAGTLFSVPVLALEEASLRSTLPFAGVGVEEVVGVFFPIAILEDGSAPALASLVVEVLNLSASGAAIASAIASVPIEESGNATDGCANGPLVCANALTTRVVEDEAWRAIGVGVDASAFRVIPSVAAGAWGPKASAAADSEGVVEVVADGARSLFADALRAVPELATFALTGLGDPSAVDFVPVLTFDVITNSHADAVVSPVVVVVVLRAFKRNEAALAPGLFPVETSWADLRVALAGTLVAVEVETDRAGLGFAEAVTTVLVPVEAWQAVGVHLDTAARAGVPSPVDFPFGVQRVAAVSRVSGTIDWHALASTGPFVPVANSGKRE